MIMKHELPIRQSRENVGSATTFVCSIHKSASHQIHFSPDTVPPVQQLIKGGRKPFTMFKVISKVTEEQLPLMRITSCPA